MAQKRVRWWRWLLRILISVFALVVLVVGGALIALQTEWGRGIVRGQLEVALDPLFAGSVRIDRIEGFLPTQPRALGIVIEDAAGRDAVTVAAVEADLSLVPLLQGLLRRRVDVDTLSVKRPDVRAVTEDDGSLNLSRLLVPPPVDPTAPVWTVNIEDLVIDDGRLRLVGASGSTTTLDRIELAASVTVAGSDAEVVVRHLAARLDDPALTFEAALRARTSSDRVSASEVNVAIDGRPTLRDGAFSLELPDGSMAGRGDVALDRALIIALTGDARWRAGARAQVAIERSAADRPWHVELDGHLGDAPFTASATAAGDLESGSLEVHAERLDPSAIHAAAPAAMVSVRLDGEAAGRSLDDLSGRLSLDAHGSVATSIRGAQRRPEVAVALEASAADGQVRGHFRGSVDGTRVRGEASASVRGIRPSIDRARVRVATQDLSSITDLLALPALEGALTATVSASGALGDLAVDARVHGRDLRFADARIRRLDLDASVTGLPERLGGRVDLMSRGVRYGEHHAGDLTIRARGARGTITASVTLANGDMPRSLSAALKIERGRALTRVHVERLDTIVRKLRWSMQDAYVTVTDTGALTVTDVRLQSLAAQVALDAELSSDLLDGPGWLRASMRAPELVLLLADVAPELPAIRGRGALVLDARLGPQPEARVSLDLTSVVFPGTDAPAQALGFAYLAPGTLTASVAVRGAELGVLNASVDLRAPRRPLDPAAWATLQARDVRVLDVSLTGVDLARIAALAPTSGLQQGRLEAEVHASPGLERLTLDIEARGLRHAYSPGPVDVDIEGAAGAKRTWLTFAAGVGPVPLAGMGLELEVGLPELIGDWKAALSPRTDLELRLQLDELPIALLADLDVEPPGIVVRGMEDHALRGEVSIDGTVTRRAGTWSGQVEARCRDIAWIAGAPRIEATLSAAITGDRLALSLLGEGPGVGAIDAAILAHTPEDPLDVAAWTRLGVDAIDSLTLDVTAVDLGSLDRISEYRVPLVGRLDARIIGSRGLRLIRGRTELGGLAARGSRTVSDSVITLATSHGNTEVGWSLHYQDRRVATATVTLGADFRELITDAHKIMTKPLFGELATEALPLDALASALGASFRVGGTLTATAALAGTLTDYQTALHVDASEATVNDLRFERFWIDAHLVPASAALRVRAQERGGGALIVDADLDLLGSREVTVTVDADRFHLDFLSAFMQGQHSVGGVTGLISGDLQVSGTSQAPRAKGTLEIDDLSLVLAPPLPVLETTHVELAFAGNALDAKLDGRSGQGALTASAHVVFEGLFQPTFEVRLQTDELPVVAGPRTAQVDAVVTVAGAVRDTITADVVIEEGLVVVRSEGAEALKPIREFDDVIFTDEPRRAATGTAAVAALPIRASVKTRKPIPIRGDEVDATGSVDLRVDSSGGPMSTNGRVTVGEGWVTLFGQRWEIRRADIIMMGIEPPRLEIELSREVGNALVMVGVVGSPEAPELRLTSDPPIYDEAQILMFVLGANPETGDEATLQDKAAGAAAGALMGAVQNKLEDKLPLDTIRVDLGDGATLGRLTLGKWITRRIFVGYEIHFDAQEDENLNEAILQLRLGRGWILESRYGDRGAAGLDLLWVKRF